MIKAEALRAYLTSGLQLIPLNRWDARDERGRERGKSPRDKRWTEAEYDSHTVATEASAGTGNVGVRLRATEMVLDVDPRNYPEGRDVLQELLMDVGFDLLDGAGHTVTGSGGHHYWFSKPADVALMDSLEDYPGIEFKSLGRQVVAAGSRHPSGSWYEWERGAPEALGGQVRLKALPEGLLKMARRPVLEGSGSAEAGDMTVEALERALASLDVIDFRDETRWRELMMSCHHATAGEGRQAFIDWSTGDPKYSDHAWLIGRRWDSLHLAPRRGGVGTSAGITSRYLQKLVTQATGRAVVNSAVDDFEAVEEYVDPAASVAKGTTADEVEAKRRAEADKVTDELVRKLNETHCVVMDSGKFRVFKALYDPVMKRPFYSRHPKADFLDMYANQPVERDGDEMTLAEAWLSSPHRRQYDGVHFDPEKDHPGWLNLWKGWAVQPARGDWSLLRELVEEVLCNGDLAHAKYVFDWIAYMVQKPWLPAEVALVFKGEKGTGKGTLGRAVLDLAGAQGVHIFSPSHLTGRFNSHLQDCICLFADEAFWAGDKSGEGTLKGLVTEPTITFEGKGRDAVRGKNLIHLIMASNSDWVVPAGLDSERRFAVFEVNNRRLGDAAFFERLNEQMYGVGRAGLSALLFDMLQRDIRGWAPRKGVPQSRALRDQKVATMDDVQRWWMDILTLGVLPGGFVPGGKGNGGNKGHEDPKGERWATLNGVYAFKSQLRDSYMEYAKQARVWRPADAITFGQRLLKLVPAMTSHQVKPLDTQAVQTDSQGRAAAYWLPPLHECRKRMEQLIGGEYDWGTASADGEELEDNVLN